MLYITSVQPLFDKTTERILRDAIAAGDTTAIPPLCSLLVIQRRHAEAEEVLLQAIASGFKEAHIGMGVLLQEELGRPADAEQCFRNALAEGVPEAYLHLGTLLADQEGREAESEQYLRKAQASNHIAATFLLGILLINQPARWDEGYQLLRRSRNAGVPMAHQTVDRIHAKQIVAMTENVRSFDSVHKACKQIDHEPQPGTYILINQRVIKFYNLSLRQLFYEPLFTYDDLLKATIQNARLNNAGAPWQKLDLVRTAFYIFDGARSAPMGLLVAPAHAVKPKEAHAVKLCGWGDGGESLIFQNSWGVTWGNQGFGTLTRAYLERYMIEGWLSRDARYGPHTHKELLLRKAGDDKAFYALWKKENPLYKGKYFKHRGYGHRVVHYRTMSAVDDRPVDVIEIHNGVGYRIAWIHLHHLISDQPQTSSLKEFFVWPCYRRQGYGTILERIACHIARARGAENIQILFHWVDARPHVRKAGRLFAMKLGYDFRWNPNKYLEAIVQKAL